MLPAPPHLKFSRRDRKVDLGHWVTCQGWKASQGCYDGTHRNWASVLMLPAMEPPVLGLVVDAGNRGETSREAGEALLFEV